MNDLLDGIDDPVTEAARMLAHAVCRLQSTHGCIGPADHLPFTVAAARS